MDLPRLAITLGDVAGIGPEVIVRAWARERLHDCCRPLVVGHPEVLRRAVRLVGSALEVADVDAAKVAPANQRVIPCLAVGDDDVLDVPPGRIDPRAGDAACRYLLAAGAMALAGRVDGIVTAPLNKEALHAAGHRYPGHTEILAELAGTANYAMMLYLGGESLRDARRRTQPAENDLQAGGRASGLGVVHVTLHMALSEALRRIDTPGILAKIRLAHDVMRQLDGPRPRVGVAAVNPHAGEGGLFGDEETRIIAPAVQRARDDGIDAAGPFPADTLFVKAVEGRYDAVVAMYHDQGHIALKLFGLHRAVNVTLGLPLVRTSPAHGTAFDIAWQGHADAAGMLEAARVAAALVDARRRGPNAELLAAERSPCDS